jgi:hypothetical protein
VFFILSAEGDWVSKSAPQVLGFLTSELLNLGSSGSPVEKENQHQHELSLKFGRLGSNLGLRLGFFI